MAQAYSFRDTTGDSLIPVADGSFYTRDMSGKFTFGECYVAFYAEDGETLVTPSAGTVTFSSTAIAGQHLPPPENATLDATLCGPEATYTPPSFNSVVTSSRMTLSGVTGASFVKAVHWRGQ